jgi:hypothetical protein
MKRFNTKSNLRMLASSAGLVHLQASSDDQCLLIETQSGVAIHAF